MDLHSILGAAQYPATAAQWDEQRSDCQPRVAPSVYSLFRETQDGRTPSTSLPSSIREVQEFDLDLI